jgi:hypothetical protein
MQFCRRKTFFKIPFLPANTFAKLSLIFTAEFELPHFHDGFEAF